MQRRIAIPRGQRDELPITHRQLAHGKLPDDDSRPSVASRVPRQLPHESLPSREGPVVVLSDAIDRTLQLKTQLLGQSGGAAPVHLRQRIDVGEAIAEQQHFGLASRFPVEAADLDHPAHGNRFLSSGLGPNVAMQHHRQIAGVGHRLPLDSQLQRRAVERHLLLNCLGKSFSGSLDGGRRPMRVGRQKLRLPRPASFRNEVARHIAHANAGLVQSLDELRVRGVEQWIGTGGVATR